MWKQIRTKFHTARKLIKPIVCILCVLSGILYMGISCLVFAKCYEKFSGLLGRICDPLYETIEEDPSYRDGVFYIYDLKDYQRFDGYVNRIWQQIKAQGGDEDIDNVKGGLAGPDIPAVLMADIDIRTDKGYGGLRHEYIRQGIMCYNGDFDGNGHTIVWYDGSRNGMFVRLDRQARIHDLKFQGELYDPDEYTWGYGDGDIGLGMICMVNYGMIENCETSGYIEGNCAVGGIAGQNYGVIENCTNRAKVKCLRVGMFGAGGIAGESRYMKSHEDGDATVEAVITDCINYGEITGTWLAGGICAEARGNGCQIKGCGNEGAVYVLHQEVQPYRDDPRYAGDDYQYMRERFEEAGVGGIAGELNAGHLIECYNTGTISNLEDGMGAAYGIAGGAFGNSEVLNCVSLVGTVADHMRHENIMELTEEEMEIWQNDHGAFPYIHNNWQFNLDEAIEKLHLAPLGIEESPETKNDDSVYLCEDFCLRAPEGFAIREISDYALCIEAKENFSATASRSIYGTDARPYQIWILRPSPEEEKAMNGFLEQTEDLNSIFSYGQKYKMGEGNSSLKIALWLSSLDDEELEADISRIWDRMDGLDWLHPLFFYNWWDHHTWQNYDGGLWRSSLNFYKEEMNAVYYTYVKNDETQSLRLDNIISMPVKEDFDGNREVRYLLLFTNKESNYRPDLSFAKSVMENCFIYLPYEVQVGRGDTLSELSQRYMGSPLYYKQLQEYNGIENADLILEGTILSLPEEWLLIQYHPQP